VLVFNGLLSVYHLDKHLHPIATMVYLLPTKLTELSAA
jgi:hypothetical protein